MNEQEMIAMQEALFAQMHGENEDIYIDDDEDEPEEGQNPNQGGGIMNYLGNLLFGGQQQQNRDEEEKK